MNATALIPMMMLVASPLLAPAQTAATEPTIDVCFSPGGGCRQRIVAEIDQAKTKLRIQSNALKSPEIAKAVRKAHQRGVECIVILDGSQVSAGASKANYLQKWDILVLVDAAHPARSNLILIDAHTIISGSMRFTQNAETKEASSVLFVKNSATLFEKFVENFASHRDHSKKYQSLFKPSEPIRNEPTRVKKSRPSEPKKEQPQEITVYVTKSGAKYHRSSCSYLKKSRIPLPLSDAAGRYGPCSRCNPPKP